MDKHSEFTPVILWSPPGHSAEQDCACAANPTVLWSLSGEQTEEDCACSVPEFTPASLVIDSSKRVWQTVDKLYQAPLPDNHTLVFNPVGAAGVVVLNKPAQRMLNAFTTPQPLTTSLAQQLAALGLLQPQKAQPTCPSPNPDTLTAWLHVTNACNLRCTYCYLHKTEEAMSEATGRAAIEAVFRSAIGHGFKAVKLKYAGGEATLNFSLVRGLHHHARLLAEQTGLKLQEVVLSNGVALSSSMLNFIHNENIRLMISLDGVGATHNAQRIFANGRGSFAQVERGIHRALKQGVTPHLSITVTGHTANRLADAVTFALEQDLFFNLNFYRDNNYSCSPETLQAEDEQLIRGMKTAFAKIEAKLPRHSLITALVDRSNFSSPHQHTCGVDQNYMVIDQHGRIARCHMEIERTISDVFEEDPLAAMKSRPFDFQNLAVDDKEGCCECEWRYWCAGGCPLLTHRVTGRSDVKSPYCNVYKSLYPDVLRLEGLRLLKWQKAPAGHR